MCKTVPDKKTNKKILLSAILLITLFFVFSNAYSLVRTSVTTGNWNQATTWDCGCVPAAADSVIIAANTIVTITGNTTVKGFTVRGYGELLFGNGVILSVDGGVLVETGGIINGSNNAANLMQFTTKNLRLTVNGIASVYRLAMNAGANSCMYFFGSGEITINSDLEVYGSNPKIYNYYVTLSVNGNIVKLGSGTFQWQQRDYSTLNIGGDMNDVDDLYTWAVNTINYNGNGDQLILCPTAPSYFWHLTISGSGIKTLDATSGGSYTDIHGNLTINEGCTLDASISSYDIHLRGNWINNGGTFIPHSDKVTLEWSNEQSITCTGSTENFYNIELNKSAGNVTLNDDVIVSHDLNLTLGDMVLGSNHLILETSCTLSGTPGVSSYVQADGDGTMKKMMNATGNFIFPIGDNDEYSPFTMDIHTATFSGDDYISANVTDAPHPMIISLNRISRYWTIGSMGLTNISYDFSCQYTDSDVEGEEGSIYALRSGESWATYAMANAVINTLYSTDNISVLPSNNDFTGGVDGMLPVEIISFNAEADDDGVIISWQTASETNNDFYTVEKSTDGYNYASVAIITGAGTSNNILNYSLKDYYPYDGVSYYRLKQTDFDGQFSYVGIVSVNFENNSDRSVLIFPSPSNNDIIHLSFKYNTNDTVFLNIYNMNGVCTTQKTLSTIIGENNVVLNTSGFAKVKYIIQIMGFNTVITSDFVKY